MKTAFKLIVIVLSCSLFVGCNLAISTKDNYSDEKSQTSSENVSSHQESYAYFTFPNVDWGITPDELCVALEKSQDDFVIKEVGNKRTFFAEVDFLGKKSKVSFSFAKGLTSPAEYLIEVQTGYEDISNEDFDKICADIIELIKEQEVPISDIHSDTFTYYESENESDEKLGTEFYFSSISTVDNLPAQMKETYNNATKNHLEQHPQSGIDPERSDFIDAQKNIPLVQLSAKYFQDSSNCNIRIACGPFASIKSTAEFYSSSQNSD